MGRTIGRLNARQTHQLNTALAARHGEFVKDRITQEEACRRLAEGLGFPVSVANLRTSVQALELGWPTPLRRGENSVKTRDLVEALVRDNLRLHEELRKLNEQLGQDYRSAAPATLVRWQRDRERARRPAADAPTQPTLPLEPAATA